MIDRGMIKDFEILEDGANMLAWSFTSLDESIHPISIFNGYNVQVAD